MKSVYPNQLKSLQSS